MLWTPEEIERAFPLTERPKTNGGAPAPAASVSEADIPAETMRVIRDGPTKSSAKDRSQAFWNVVMALKRLGFTAEGILELLERHPEGVAEKYEGRLQQEVERAYNKIAIDDENGSQTTIAAATTPTPQAIAAATSAPAPASTSASGPSPLDDVHGTFKKWLGKDYDTNVLNVVLAAGAAERLTGDPLWPLVISGPGNAKTETVQSLAGAGAQVTSTITSEGALLSATPRQLQAGRATGGLLLKLGSRGLLVIKDFTSILSMDRNARGLVLAALREIYDGKWERNVGAAGGRTLTWTGRLVIVGACTTAWDAAHTVIGVMGDRFIVVRADSETSEIRTRSAWQAIHNTGKETAMRAELAAAVGRLIASASTDEYQLAQDETDQLIKLANIVTWTRTGVERDYKGEMVDAHALEMPTRFVKQLTQLVRGSVAIGLLPAAAMQLAVRCSRDRIAPLRRRILLDIAAHPNTRSREVANRTSRPHPTIRRELQGLNMLGVLDCDRVNAVQGGRERTLEYYSLAKALDRDLLLSM